MSKLKIGYIRQNDTVLNPDRDKFEFCEASYSRRISSRGDKVYSKLLAFPVDYEEVSDNAEIMKQNAELIIVREPFILDDELRKKVVKWVEWANKAEPSEYDPFAKRE